MDFKKFEQDTKEVLRLLIELDSVVSNMEIGTVEDMRQLQEENPEMFNKIADGYLKIDELRNKLF